MTTMSSFVIWWLHCCWQHGSLESVALSLLVLVHMVMWHCHVIRAWWLWMMHVDGVGQWWWCQQGDGNEATWQCGEEAMVGGRCGWWWWWRKWWVDDTQIEHQLYCAWFGWHQCHQLDFSLSCVHKCCSLLFVFRMNTIANSSSKPIHSHSLNPCMFLMGKLIGYMLKYYRNHNLFWVHVISSRGRQKTRKRTKLAHLRVCIHMFTNSIQVRLQKFVVSNNWDYKFL